MNDRCLYRAKRIDNGEWIVGNRIDDGVTGQVFIHAAGNTVNESDKVGEDGCLRFVAFEVDPSTICQCTGIKDKNGKLIWENDIVKHDFGKEQIGVQLAIVKYDSKYACYQIKPIFDWMYCDKSDCEVIGNIFDNPELLEVGCGQELDWGEEK